MEFCYSICKLVWESYIMITSNVSSEKISEKISENSFEWCFKEV